MKHEWTPPEDRIADLTARFTPRQLAIAYLRASRRAREAELLAGMEASIMDATIAVMTGNEGAASAALDGALRAARTAGETLEGRIG